MKDTVIVLLTIAAMIGSAVISANKKKKEAAEKAARSAKSNSQAPEVPPTSHTAPKSLGEILEELARGELYTEPTREPSEPDYFDEELARLAEEEESAAARLAEMSYKPMRPDSVERNIKKIVNEIVVSTEQELDEPAEEGSIEAILADFDLRRAVIESEILAPKYKEYLT
jgi:hypothetical protein